MSMSRSAVGVVKFLGVALACIACAVTSTVARAEPTPCSVDSQVLALLISVRTSDEAQRFPYLLMDVQEEVTRSRERGVATSHTDKLLRDAKAAVVKREQLESELLGMLAKSCFKSM